MEEQDEQEVFYFDNDIQDDYDNGGEFEAVFFGGIVMLLIAIYALLYAAHPRF